MPARADLFICEVKAYQTCTTLSPHVQLGVKVIFLWNMIAIYRRNQVYCHTQKLHAVGDFV